MRIVVKIGSSSLVTADGLPQLEVIDALTTDIAAVVDAGHDVLIVSSGAIATGLGLLQRATRPTELPALQAASAVGQGELFATWSRAFDRHGVRAAQVLLTMHDAAQRATWANARNTLEQLLEWQVVPIINENDTTATDEITFGDNDALAAQVAVAVGADLLVLLTDTDGLYTDHPDAPGAELVREVDDHSLLQRVNTATSGSHWGSGGMRSKVVAAEMAASGGVVTHIARATAKRITQRLVAGESVGTRIAASRARNRKSAFRLWLQHGKRVRGTIVVDAGARAAIVERGASLLPVGITEVQGAFEPGDAVAIAEMGAPAGASFARGIAQYSSVELAQLGRDGASAQRGAGEAVHRDQLVLLDQ
ncbi:MAG: glutamate 5-kinase [Thermoleophilia bacterium]|nr:glutamate 5-kinase [Thermoleophilia bacterium]